MTALIQDRPLSNVISLTPSQIDEVSVPSLAPGPSDEDRPAGFVLQARMRAESNRTPIALARLAKAEFDAGNRVSSIAAATELSDRTDGPAMSEASLLVAIDVMLAAGETELADALISKIDSPSALAILHAARSLARSDDFAAAARLLDSADCVSAEIDELRGRLAIEQHDYSSAIRYLRRSLNSEGHTPSAYINLTYALSAVGSTSKAISAARAAHSLVPASPVATFNLVAALVATGEIQQALHVVTTYSELFPADLDAWFARSNLVAALDGPRKALDELRRHGGSRFFDQLTPREQVEYDAFVLGTRFDMRELSAPDAFSKAVKLGERVAFASPRVAHLIAHISTEFYEMSSLTSALEQAETVLDSSELWGLRIQRAMLADAAPDVVRQLIDSWRMEVPVDIDVWLMGSHHAILSCDFKRAEEFSMQGLRRFPAHYGLANNLAFSLALQGHPQAARARLPQIDSPQIRATAAAVRLAEGDINGGHAAYDQLIGEVAANDPSLAERAALYKAFASLVIAGQLPVGEIPDPSSGWASQMIRRSIDSLLGIEGV